MLADGGVSCCPEFVVRYLLTRLVHTLRGSLHLVSSLLFVNVYKYFFPLFKAIFSLSYSFLLSATLLCVVHNVVLCRDTQETSNVIFKTITAQLLISSSFPICIP